MKARESMMCSAFSMTWLWWPLYRRRLWLETEREHLAEWLLQFIESCFTSFFLPNWLPRWQDGVFIFLILIFRGTAWHMVGTQICKIMYLIWLKPRIYMRIWLNTDKCELWWLQRHYLNRKDYLNVCCCRSVAESCLTLCNLTDYSTPCSAILRCLLEFAQIHVH